MFRMIGPFALMTLPALLMCCARIHAAEGEPGISNVTVNTKTVPRYEKFEITFNATGKWSNPFDPDKVAIDGMFVTPDGKAIIMPAFYFQDFQRAFINGYEKLTPLGEPVWKVRFCPTAPGTHRFKLRLASAGKTVETEEQAFECTDNGNKHGFLRVAKENPHYFRFDDDTPFFAVGMNVATLANLGTGDGSKWYASLARTGGNLVRSWWCAAHTDLESQVSDHPQQGLGKYKLSSAWRIDCLVEMAEELDIYIMACLETQQYLRRECWWPKFTYNAANGGPVKLPADFFVNQECDKYFQKRLRYIVARWSYSTAIFSWQFWNEVSACNDYHNTNAAKWHERMGRYLRSIDPYQHIIHTNYGNMDGYKEVDSLPETEVVSTNIYSRRDMGQTSAWYTRVMTSRYNKPYLMTEYGPGHHGKWIREDPKGVIVHNGLWGAVMSGSAGTGLPWGWSNWIDPQNMYHYWKPAADVTRDIPFHKRQWKAVTVEKLAFKDAGKPPYYAGAFFEGWPRNFSYTWVEKPLPTKFRVLPDGEVENAESFNAVLQEKGAHAFSMDFPVDGEFVVHIPEISEGGKPVLHITVDDKKALQQPLPRDTEDPWSYWKHYPVAVKAGHHEIEVLNTGTGQILTAYELTKFIRREGPDLDVMGIQTDDILLIWTRNPQFIWIYDKEGRKLEEQEAGILTLKDVPDGQYSVTWCETTTGEVLARQAAKSNGGRLTLATPPITRSAVAKLWKTMP
ncbi:MAG: DUF5060 domain-containing protein [Planctomycetota bacterium]